MKTKLITITLLSIGALFITTSVSATDEFPELGVFMPGAIEGTGTYFEITDSEYLNVILQSSEEITVSLESIPKVVSLTIEASTLSESSILTIGGLESNKTYHKYEDSFKNEAVFNCDENGSYSWAQDLTQSHRVWIQEEKGTTFIPSQCSNYGVWDEDGFTCTLTQDIAGSLEITQSNIVLDCNSHSITGTGASYSIGILLGKTGVTIKNCNVDNFSYGILLSGSQSNELRGNSVSNNLQGLRLDANSSGNYLIENNSFNNSSYGIMLSYGSNNNILRGNVMNNNLCNFGVWGFYTSDYVQNIDTSNIVNGKPIYYLVGEQNRVIDASSNAGYVGIVNSQDIEVRDMVLENNFQGVVVSNTQDLIIDSLTLSNNFHSIYLHSVSNTTTTHNNIAGGLNGYGISVHFSDHNSISHNTTTQNGGGIQLSSSSYNNITGNTMSFNSPGIYMSGVSSSTISGNQILSNNSYGVHLVSSYNNLVSDNTIVDNKWGGIRLSGSYDNVIIENTIAENKSYASFGYGIDFTHALSANNEIYHNNFIDNYYKPQVRVLASAGQNSFDDGYQSGGNYWSDYDSAGEGCLDGNGDGFCDAPYTFTGGQDNYPFMVKDGWLLPQLPQTFWSEISVPSASALNLRVDSSTAADILKQLPNGWAVKIASSTDLDGNFIENEGYRWYKVEDASDETVGFMKAAELDANGQVVVEYPSYLPDKQAEFELKANYQLTDLQERKDKIVESVAHYYDNTSTTSSLYSSNDGDNNISILKTNEFLRNLILAIAVQESKETFGRRDGQVISSEFNNALKNWDNGYGIMQITTPSHKGLGSNLKVYNEDCGDPFREVCTKRDENKQCIKWTSEYLCNWYVNTSQSIYSNIKDGLRTLQEKYNQSIRLMSDPDVIARCPINIDGIQISCSDLEKILTVWGYNGFGKDKNGNYSNYLGDVANSFENINKYFTQAIPNPALIKKLRDANDNKTLIKLNSPGELQIIDSQGRISGRLGSETKEEIPFSWYDDNEKGVVVFFPDDTYSYQIVGTQTGIYDFVIESTENGSSTIFTAATIPIEQNEIHTYVVDWIALSNNERGVTLDIDYEGDGIIDQTIISDNELYDIEPPQIITSPLGLEYFLNSELQIQFSATDTVSGINNVTATLNGTEVTNNQIVTLNKIATNTLEVIAIDNDGNVSNFTQTFNVIYNFEGFLPPIKPDGSGVYKQGRTLPTKFKLTDTNNDFANSAIAHLYLAKMSDGIIGSDDVALSTSAADTGNVFRYDTGDNQYIFNLSTDTMDAGTWQLKVELDDNKYYNVLISIRG